MTDPGPHDRRPHGALRDAVLEAVVHADRPVTAQEVRSRFDTAEHVPALSTVLTVLDRLRRQGTVVRSTGRTGEYEFAPAGASPDSAAHSMLDMLLRSGDRQGALVRFAGSLDREDLDLLRAAIDRQGPPARRRR